MVVRGGFLLGSRQKSVGSLPGGKSVPGEPPAKRITGLFYTCSASVGFSGPLWASDSQPASPPASQPASQAHDRFPGRNSASQPASLPGWSTPNTLLLPATAPQSKGSASEALAWQRGQPVDRCQSIWMLNSKHSSSCFHCLTKQVLCLDKFLLAVRGQVVEHWSH